MTATSAISNGQRVSSTSSLRMFWTVLNPINGSSRPKAMRPAQAASRNARTTSICDADPCASSAIYTFSTSGRPSSPCGRKIMAMTRIEKAATSL